MFYFKYIYRTIRFLVTGSADDLARLCSAACGIKGIQGNVRQGLLGGKTWNARITVRDASFSLDFHVE